MANVKDEDWEAFDLSVSAKVIQHISSGIYRTPGGAVKELISNSFDAQATWVTVRTGYPTHRSFVVEDDGVGMTEQLIRRSFSRIGASVKVSDSDLYKAKSGRPVIGRFGIGILAAAHISHKIKFATYPKDQKHGLACELDLEPFFDFASEVKTLEEVALGTVRFKEIPRDGHKHGTVVELTDIPEDSNFHRTICRKGKQTLVEEWPPETSQARDSGQRMLKFVQGLHSAGLNTTETMWGRERLLWELGLICPVPYLPNGPIEPRFLKGEAKTIVEGMVRDASKNSFTLFFDGIEVRKPILLPTPKVRSSYVDREDPSLSDAVDVFPIKINKTKAGISARGYLVHQPNVIHPREIQGLYPRIHGVGVGQYDNSLFRTIQGEQPIIRVRVSGEIYIEGIDKAINLDRSGFNELAVEFQSLLEELQHVLSGPGAVLSEVKRRSEETAERVSEVKDRVRTRKAQEKVRKVLSRGGRKVSIREPASRPTAPRSAAIRYPFVTILEDEQGITVDPDVSDPRLAQVIIAVDEFLAEMPGGDELRRNLAARLRKLFGDA